MLQENQSYASFSKRVLSWLVDGVIFAGVALVGLVAMMAYMLNVASDDTRGDMGTWLLMLFGVALLANLLLALYCLVFWSRGGQTVGKRVVKLRVVRSDGRPLGVGAALLRLAAFIVLSQGLLIGYLWPAFDRERRTLHDIAAGTRVVKA